jgi:hypothetical protein
VSCGWTYDFTPRNTYFYIDPKPIKSKSQIHWRLFLKWLKGVEIMRKNLLHSAMGMAIAMMSNANGKKSIMRAIKVYTYTPLLVTYNYFVPFRQTTKQ